MIRRVIRAIDEHWFGPLPEVYLSLARIVIFGGLLFFLIRPFPSGEPALLGLQRWWTGVDSTLYVPIPALKVMLLPFGEWGAVRPDAALLQGVWLLAITTAVTAVLGIHTRAAMLACAASVTLLVGHQYSYHEFHHPWAPLVIAVWVLALGPITRTASWTSFTAGVREAVRTRTLLPLRSPKAEHPGLIRWPLRLIQWLLVLVYLSAGISKLLDGGLDWFNGHTLAYYVTQDTTFFLGGEGPGMWLSQHRWIMRLLSVGAVLFELTFALAILFPRIAWVYVVGGIAMHTSIDILQRAAFFQFFPLYIVFAESVHITLKGAAMRAKHSGLSAVLLPWRRQAPREAT